VEHSLQKVGEFLGAIASIRLKSNPWLPFARMIPGFPKSSPHSPQSTCPLIAGRVQRHSTSTRNTMMERPRPQPLKEPTASGGVSRTNESTKIVVSPKIAGSREIIMATVSPNKRLSPKHLTVCRLYLAADDAPTFNVPVSSLMLASEIWQKYRNGYLVRSSTMKSRCGRICAPNRRLMALVSYNGRVWSPAGELVEEAAELE